jgi:hypothetical protein
VDQDEILEYSAKIIEKLGPEAEEIFALGVHYERIAIFSKLRDLICEKDLSHDTVASDILAWAWEQLSNN